jgi:hypothetical protein
VIGPVEKPWRPGQPAPGEPSVYARRLAARRARDKRFSWRLLGGTR